MQKKKKEFIIAFVKCRMETWTSVWLYLVGQVTIVFTFLSFTGKKLEGVETRKNKKPLTLEGVN